MSNNLTEKHFVVFGATGGVGSTLSKQIVGSSGSVLLVGRDSEKLSPLASELKQESIVCDVRNPDQIAGALEHAKQSFGSVDGIVNCCGSVILKPAHLTTEDEWAETIAVNLTSSFAIVKYGVPLLRERKGSLVLIASAAATIGLANHEAIAAAKAGVIGLARSASATYAPKGVRVNVVSPGLVQTQMTAHITEKEASRKFSLAMHPVGRLGEPEDIASGILWFLAPEQTWVTGQVLGIDGGLSGLKA